MECDGGQTVMIIVFYVEVVGWFDMVYDLTVSEGKSSLLKCS